MRWLTRGVRNACMVVVLVGCGDREIPRAAPDGGIAGMFVRDTLLLDPNSLTLVDSALVNVRGVIEVSSERIAIGDGNLNEVRLIDVGDRSVGPTPVGRRGEGPGEYESVAWLIRIPGTPDTIGVWDPRQGRLAKFGRSGFVAGTERYASSAPIGVGGRGERLTVAKRGEARTPRGFVTDSLVVSWIPTPDAAGIDVAEMRGRSLSIFRYEGRGSVISNPIMPPAQAVLTSDDWVAVVRAVPLSLEWHDPRSGESVRWADSRPPGRFESAQRDSALSRLGMPEEFAEHLEWPEVEPAFPVQGPGGGGTVLPGPGSCVTVLRTLPYVAPEGFSVYEIFNREEGLVSAVRVPPGMFIAGFGRYSERAYVVKRDEFGIQSVWRSSALRLPDERCRG